MPQHQIISKVAKKPNKIKINKKGTTTPTPNES